jgi:threonine dehydrogenase-like Zn-dependent dehydrogenase
MKAIWLEDQKISVREDVPVPVPAENEALIKVTLGGICATDLELVKGYYPFKGVLGHEFAGVVVSSPQQPEYEGRRVVGEINIACGVCKECRANRRTHCENRSVLGIANHHGAFAEYLTLPIENLHLIDEQITDDQAVFVEPLAAAVEILEQTVILPDERVLLIGAGRLGLLIAQCVRLLPSELWVVTRNPMQNKLLDRWHIPTLETERIPARSFDTVIEATGTPMGFELARKAIRPRGKLVIKSTYHGLLEINMSAIVVDELTIIGSRCGPFPPAIRLLRDQKVDVLPLIMGRYPLTEGVEAFQRAGERGILKVLLEIGS